MIHTIIIAVDSRTARLVTRRCLEIAGYFEAVIQEARDGREALELAKSQPPDLLVTDLNMPIMDGASLLKHLKANPRLHSVPVIVISSMGNEAKVKELMKLGAFAVLSKPINPAAIMETLQNLSEHTAGVQL